MTQTKIGVGMINATSIGDAKVLQGDGAWVTPSAPGLKFISSTDISAAATFAFTAVDASSYDGYGVFLQNIVPVTDAVFLWMRTSTDAGSSYDTGSSDYKWEVEIWGSYKQDQSDAQISLIGNEASGGYRVGSAANESGVSGWVYLIGPHLTGYTMVRWDVSVFADDGSMVAFHGAGCRASAADVDAFQLLFSSGNIESGTINVYGLANA